MNKLLNLKIIRETKMKRERMSLGVKKHMNCMKCCYQLKDSMQVYRVRMAIRMLQRVKKVMESLWERRVVVKRLL
jgi:hypothetical protein